MFTGDPFLFYGYRRLFKFAPGGAKALHVFAKKGTRWTLSEVIAN